MSKILKSIVSIFIICAFFSGMASANNSVDTVNFQGFLSDTDGKAVPDGMYSMTVNLWDGPDNETANKVWEETHTPTVSRGLYSISLGASVPFPYTLSFAKQYFLGVSILGEPLDQLIPLTNTWSAFRAKTAGGRIIKNVSENYTIDDTDDILLTSGNVTLTLPEASTVLNRIFTIKKMDTSNTLSIVTNGSETIDGINRGSGGAALEVSSQYNEVSVISDGHNWISMGVTFGIVSHEKGGLETDISDFEGLVKISGGATSALTITSAGENLLDDTDIVSQRTTLGLGSSATQDYTSVNIDGGACL